MHLARPIYSTKHLRKCNSMLAPKSSSDLERYFPHAWLPGPCAQPPERVQACFSCPCTMPTSFQAPSTSGNVSTCLRQASRCAGGVGVWAWGRATRRRPSRRPYRRTLQRHLLRHGPFAAALNSAVRSLARESHAPHQQLRHQLVARESEWLKAEVVGEVE